MDYPKRKSPRIPHFDYALPYYYFVTICTHEKQIMFGKPGRLNDFGNIAEQFLQEIPVKYPEVILDKYVVMPNHVHAILILTQNQNENHSLSRIVGQYKMSVTKK